MAPAGTVPALGAALVLGDGVLGFAALGVRAALPRRASCRSVHTHLPGACTPDRSLETLERQTLGLPLAIGMHSDA